MSRFFCLLLLGLTTTYSAQAEQLKVNISAGSAILMNADTGGILFEKNSHQPSYPASVTKIATALYAVEKYRSRLDEQVVAVADSLAVVIPQVRQAWSKHPSYRLETDGTMLGIRVGEKISFKDLIYGLLLVSGNDAANVIARHVSGDIETFMEELNGYLKRKGLKVTRFNNPHGLHHPEHHTTAFEIAILGRELLKDPFLKEVVKTVRYTRPETNKQPAFTMVQTNRLLRAGGPFYYPKAIGIKTGNTAKAKKTLIAAAADGNRTLIAVLLNCSDFNQRYKDAIALFEAAFSQKPISRTLFSQAHDPFTLSIKGAKAPLEAKLIQDCQLQYYPAEEPVFKPFVRWKQLSLPIQKGEEVGRLEIVTPEGMVLQTTPLIATKQVERGFWSQIGHLFYHWRHQLLFGLLGMAVLLAMLKIVKKPKKPFKR